MRHVVPTTRRVRVSQRFSHAVDFGRHVVLVGDEESVVLTGPMVERLVRLLDGTRSAFEIAEDLYLAHRADLVYDALSRLEAGGLLATDQDAAEHEPPSSSHLNSSSRAGVTSEIVADAWAARSARGLAWAEIDDSVIDDPVSAGVRLLITDDYLRPEVEAAATGPSSTGQPILLARLGWDSVWLGPYVQAANGACVTCLSQRLRLNLPGRALVHAMGGLPPLRDEGRLRVLRDETPSTAFRLLGGLIADTVGRSKGLASLEDQLVVRRTNHAGDEFHRVQRLADCPRCGTPGLTVPGAHVRLAARPKARGGSGGGSRMASPAATLRRFQHLVDPLTGAVRHLERVESVSADCVHVYTANHAGGAAVATLASVRSHHRDHSGGKGSTDLDAKVSALCESLERYSALFRDREPERLASRDEIGDSAVTVREILHMSAAQYDARVEWNRWHADDFQWIPEPCPDDEPISWTPVMSLVTGELSLAPTAAVYLGFRGQGAQYVRGDTNGLAGGNCLEEAVLHAFLELVERDAVAIWWYNRLALPAVDMDSSSDPYIAKVRDFYDHLERDLWVLDLTSDLAVPCFAAISSRRHMARQDIVFGFGAHLDAAIALRRALTELNQMLPTVLKGPEERARQLLPEFADVIDWWATSSLESHPYLVPDPEARVRQLRDLATHDNDDLLTDVTHCVSLARSRGLDVLVCDLTRPDIGLSVARVLVPPLRHFWRRLGPGRLYDVPVAMGRLETAKSESEMNPTSMFV